MINELNLRDVKAGDKLIVSSSGYSRLNEVVTVERVTATQIVTKNGRFNKETGYAPRGDSYTRLRVWVPRDGELRQTLDKLEAAKLATKMRHSIKWDEIPLTALRDINAVLAQHNK